MYGLRLYPAPGNATAAHAVLGIQLTTTQRPLQMTAATRSCDD
jgi:hypothetical protein